MNDEYMTVEEFAALTSGQHHAVWAARCIDTIPAGGGDGIRRYHREQVRKLLATGEQGHAGEPGE